MKSKKEKKLVANPEVILREDFKTLAILFDPDKVKVFTINRVGLAIWKLIDGKHNIREISKKVESKFKDTPKSLGQDIVIFIEDMIRNGLVTIKR